MSRFLDRAADRLIEVMESSGNPEAERLVDVVRGTKIMSPMLVHQYVPGVDAKIFTAQSLRVLLENYTEDLLKLQVGYANKQLVVSDKGLVVSAKGAREVMDGNKDARNDSDKR